MTPVSVRRFVAVGADAGRTQMNYIPAITDLLHAYDLNTRALR